MKDSVCRADARHTRAAQRLCAVHGYTLAVYACLSSGLSYVAVPFRSDAVSAPSLAVELERLTGGKLGEVEDGLPLGRVAVVLHLPEGVKADLSIYPPAERA